MKTTYLWTTILFLTPFTVKAHDTWVQTNTNVVRVGNNIHIDLMLGNHGNDHRDFKLASKVDPAADKFEVILPDGKKLDLKDRLADVGYTPKEGFWTTTFTGAKPGLYIVGHSSDQIVFYAPKRSLKSSKTCFVMSASLDKVPEVNPGFDKPLGHPLEIVPVTNPVTPMGPGVPLKVQLLYKGKPMAKNRVSFIPRGESLTEEFDARFERMTDEQGLAQFTPNTGNYYLIVAHWEDATESGKGFQSTKYSATLTVFVPQICPCCAD